MLVSFLMEIAKYLNIYGCLFLNKVFIIYTTYKLINKNDFIKNWCRVNVPVFFRLFLKVCTANFLNTNYTPLDITLIIYCRKILFVV